MRFREALSGARGPAEERDRALFLLMLETGLRLGSALALRRGDIDLADRLITVRHGKRGSSYEVYLTDELRDMLAEHFTRYSGDLVFAGPGNRQLSPRSVQKRFELWRRRGGVREELSLHSLRHTAAMRVYARTGDVLVVKEALGHRSIASTLVYARPNRSQVAAAVRTP